MKSDRVEVTTAVSIQGTTIFHTRAVIRPNAVDTRDSDGFLYTANKVTEDIRAMLRAIEPPDTSDA